MGILCATFAKKKTGPGQVRSYDTIKGTASSIFFLLQNSFQQLVAIEWNGDIMHDLGQKMATSDQWHAFSSFDGHPRSMTLAEPIFTYNG